MADLTGREIFAVGKWNGIEFSEADLDDIVANFQKLQEQHKVPLKLGHNDEQDITDGQPALGWVQRVYRQGKKLLADFADVPNVIVDAIKKKLYRSVSVELLFNVDDKGTKFNHVLDAVAILGADHPAVNTLADLDALLATRTAFTGGHRVAFTVSEGNQHSNEGFDMDDKRVEELIAKAIAPLESLLKEEREKNVALETELKAKREEDEKREKQIREEKIAARRKEVVGLLDAAVKAKQMTPAVREIYSKQIGVDDDEKVLSIEVEQVKAMCGASFTKPDGQTGKTMEQEDEQELSRPDEELVRLTKKYQAEHNVQSFAAAFQRVAEANPKLHRAYLDSNVEG